MRIANIYARFKTMSGGPVFLLKLADAVLKQGHRFDIITRDISDRCRPYVPQGVNVILPERGLRNTGSQLIDSALDLLFASRLSALVPADADVLCVHSDAALPALYAYCHRMKGKLPCVYYCYQPTQFAYNLTWEKARAYAPLGYLIPLIAPAYRAFDKKSAKCADSIIAFSSAYQNWCKELYMTDRVFRVAPGADGTLVDQAKPEEARQAYHLDKRPVVLTVNKLVCQKNVDLLIRAMAIVVKSCPDAAAVIVGDGPEKGRLTALVQKLKLERSVFLIGFLKEWREVCNFYAACDLLVFLERDVPFGMTVAEAGNYGKPTVAVASGGTLDTVDDGETGLLVDPVLSVDEIAQKIVMLLQNDGLRKEMGNKAKIKANACTWERCGREFCDVMEKTISRKQA
ncbi:MAG: glycosyltransferase family 4 protein [Lentisphaerae bacterium]|nr:glycosyltransferase family 4 protein [Lentisphaerota bacterium]